MRRLLALLVVAVSQRVQERQRDQPRELQDHVKAVIEDQQLELDQLQRYIAS